MTARVLTLHRANSDHDRAGRRQARDDIDAAWREACHHFLFAALNGASGAVLRRMSAELFVALDATSKGPAP